MPGANHGREMAVDPPSKWPGCRQVGRNLYIHDESATGETIGSKRPRVITMRRSPRARRETRRRECYNPAPLRSSMEEERQARRPQTSESLKKYLKEIARLPR